MRPALRLLTGELIARIVAEAREVLSRLGVEIHNPEVLALLADYGADVVKVEMPGPGDALRALAPHKDGVPLCGVPWKPTRPPVVLEEWPVDEEAPDCFSTIATWENKGKDIAYEGETYYWSKDREFMKIIDLPRRRAVPFELAIGQDEKAQQILRNNGWGWVGLTLVFGHFLLPFVVLLSRGPKRRPGLLAIAAGWMLLMHLVDA